jgi:hypothetical protein
VDKSVAHRRLIDDYIPGRYNLRHLRSVPGRHNAVSKFRNLGSNQVLFRFIGCLEFQGLNELFWLA